MDHDELLAAAKAAPAKVRLEEYREVVQELRGKGFTWREVADFLTERGVPTDHSWVYRTFGKRQKTRHVESRPIEISRAKYVGTRETKKGGAWNLLEIELPSTLGQPIPVVASFWAKGAAKLELGDDSTVAVRDATLVTKAGGSFPMAYIKAELRAVGDQWSPQEMYILPKWDVLLGERR